MQVFNQAAQHANASRLHCAYVDISLGP